MRMDVSKPHARLFRVAEKKNFSSREVFSADGVLRALWRMDGRMEREVGV